MCVLVARAELQRIGMRRRRRCPKVVAEGKQGYCSALRESRVPKFTGARAQGSPYRPLMCPFEM
jgi:hypothetical protein